MKNNKKGLTVTSIVVYVVLFFMFTSITTVISSRFNKNLFNDRGTAINTTALNKLQYNLLASANESYNVKGDVDGSKTTLTFSNSDEYVFDLDKNAVFKNGGKLVNYVKEFDVRLLDDIIDIDITVNKYTNELAKNIKVSVHTEDYIDNGLIAHYDGINNTGTKEHSSDSRTWKDLSSNDVAVTLSNSFTHDGTTNGWLENGILFPIEIGSSVGNYTATRSNTINPLQAVTIEFNINILDDWLNKTDYSDYIYPLVLGGLKFGFRQNTRLAYGFGNNTVFDGNLSMNNRQNYTITFVQSDLSTRIIYLNGAAKMVKTGLTLDEINVSNISMRSYFYSKYIFHSVRVYDKALTDEEIKHNYMIDRLRFGEK